MILILKFLVLGLFLITKYGVEGVRSTSESISKSKEDDFELDAQLNLLNKPSIKTFHTEWGDIVDCINIHKQPAFDHPLLKNHELQLTSEEEMDTRRENSGKNKSDVNLSEFMSQDLHCPEGTVPIRRTTKADLLRIKSLSASSNAPFEPHRAVINMAKQGQRYYGANARINVYNPKVDPDQYTNALLWISKADLSLQFYDVIQGGWMVSPVINGDSRTRLFGFWTGDGFNQTGCWDMYCPGFVQVHKRIYINAPIKGISVYGGPQYAIDVLISEGQRTGHWWLTVGGQDIGYWPQELFKGLVYGADFLSWGGQVLSGANGICPPIGSGQIPEICYMQHVQYKDEFNRLVDVKNDMPVAADIDCPNLYTIDKPGYQGPEVGYEFYFGGPGGRCIP